MERDKPGPLHDDFKISLEEQIDDLEDEKPFLNLDERRLLSNLNDMRQEEIDRTNEQP